MTEVKTAVGEMTFSQCLSRQAGWEGAEQKQSDRKWQKGWGGGLAALERASIYIF